MADEDHEKSLLVLTADIVSAHLRSSPLKLEQLPQLIGEVYGSLARAAGGQTTPSTPAPAVPIRKSVTPDHVVCLEDGLKFKMIKRHLRTAHDLSTDEYRVRWHLPVDHPMVAPHYAKRRSRIAHDVGLGTKRIRRRGGKRENG